MGALGAWRCDSLRDANGWWDSQCGDDLDEFTNLFLDCWENPEAHDLVRHLAHHLIEANKSTITLEGRIMLAGAGLEYLSWVKHVLIEKRRGPKERGRAADNLRDLLVAAGISSDFPTEVSALSALQNLKAPADGPEAITWVRNRLVHPKDAHEPYRIEKLLVEAWQLLLEYGELLLLHELGYRGSFRSRFPIDGWAHASRPVPWANQPTST